MMIIVSIVRLFPDTVDILSPPLCSLGPCYCLLLLRCAGAGTSDTNDETLQPTVFSPETLTFTLELVNANLEFLGFRLQRSLALLFLQPKPGRCCCVASSFIFCRRKRGAVRGRGGRRWGNGVVYRIACNRSCCRRSAYTGALSRRRLRAVLGRGRGWWGRICSVWV